ncbi:SH3 domain Src-like 3 domain protein [Rhizoctonia solani 123E]|uniref:SH3 domain Src-like 3 domain protein n=1 Tax=Rhizoctonia solani 123E TaxID=1423351 RepID=A0A074SVE6_9AGAM|nr:SH3 domain Src-like 3 domain protein [Rhizoctonia solani 123E]
MFSRMTHEDKLAFFELLDEYFESRPHLISREPEYGGAASQPAAVAANAVHRTMAANPQATADLISTGLKNIPKGSQYSAASNPVVANAAGRFAASSIASSFGGGAKSPPAPPKRNVGTTDDSPSPSRPAQGGLLSSKRFGDVDTSSITAAFTSSFKGGKPAPAPASSTLPPALDNSSRRSFAPPPVRRVPANTPSEGDASAESKNKWGNQNQGPIRRVPSHNTLQRQPTPEPEPAHGEPAEALYDYNSGAAEDINVRQGERFMIVERTSDDWWTGEVNGRRGLLPASYVRIL